MGKHQIIFPLGHVKKDCEDTIRAYFAPAGLEIGFGRVETKVMKYCMSMAHIISLAQHAIMLVYADRTPECGLLSVIVPASMCSYSLTILPYMAVIFMSLLEWIGMEGEISNRQWRCIFLMAALSIVNLLNVWLARFL